MNDNKKMHVLIVDDDINVRESLSAIMGFRGYDYIACENGAKALVWLEKRRFDVMISDIKMPWLSGIELLNIVKKKYPELPVIIMTGYTDLENAVSAINIGAFDFALKPLTAELFLNSVEKALVHSKALYLEKNYKATLEKEVTIKTRELTDALKTIKNINIEITKKMTAAAEYRDSDTGEHIVRIGLYTKVLSEELKMSSDFIEEISFASQLHDIGKIGIPDNILLKTCGLTFEEFEVIKKHPIIGHSILTGSTYKMIQMAASIALNHHERWDGSGYPNNLKGEEIPIEARIINICDQFDALIMRRPYKPALPAGKVVEIITTGDGRTIPQHFDPAVLTAFKRVYKLFIDIYEKNQ
ncbi:MAG: response regulator [Nitrospirae bacterium]|nr:response regulator [Nitrospirota bacterium]MBF0541730.1 response regulator [Nitrospirota bacterium]